MKTMIQSILAVAIVALALTGCSSSYGPGESAIIKPSPATNDIVSDDSVDDLDMLEDELEDETKPVSDPIEGWNRKMFVVNDALYVWVARPVLNGYKAIAPEPVRVGVKNVFDNIAMPVRGVNCLLQGKGQAAKTELNRFLINTTVGILGINDAADEKYQIKAPPVEDLGQTLAVWGVGDGWYLVWPLLGPGTVRDSGGWVGYYFLDPLTYIPPWVVRAGVKGTRGVNAGSFSLKEYDTMREEAIDPYTAVRDAYTQYRAAQIKK